MARTRYADAVYDVGSFDEVPFFPDTHAAVEVAKHWIRASAACRRPSCSRVIRQPYICQGMGRGHSSRGDPRIGHGRIPGGAFGCSRRHLPLGGRSYGMAWCCTAPPDDVNQDAPRDRARREGRSLCLNQASYQEIHQGESCPTCLFKGRRGSIQTVKSRSCRATASRNSSSASIDVGRQDSNAKAASEPCAAACESLSAETGLAAAVAARGHSAASTEVTAPTCG